MSWPNARRHSRRYARRRLLRWLFVVPLLALVGGVASLIAPAAANASQAPIPHCTATASWVNIGHGPVIRVHTQFCGSQAEELSVALWWAPSLDGRPLSSQKLVAVMVDGPAHTADYDVPLVADGECFWQADVAWGPPSIPYGDRLIAAWHGGVTDCVTPPPTTPPAPSSPPVTTPPASSPPVTTPPASSPPVTTPPASSPPVTTPPVTTPPVTTPPLPSATPSRPTVHHTPKPSHTPAKRPHKTTPAPAPSASGCIASGCHSATPRPPAPTTAPPTLPFTGTPAHFELLMLGGSAALVAGIGLVALAARRRG